MTADYAPRRPSGKFAYYHDRDGVEQIVEADDLHTAIATFGTFVRRATTFDLERLNGEAVA